MNPRPPLSQITQSGDFLPRCADLASRIPKAADSAEVAALLAEAAELLGADAAAFASFVRDDESYESYRFILACDGAWCNAYEDGASYMHDPWLDYARHHSEPVRASAIVPRTQREREVIALARQFGFESAVIVPAQAPQGLTRLGGLCLGSAQPGYFDSEGFTAVTFAATPLAMRLHEWQIGELRQELLGRAQLTRKDIALLHHEWAGRGTKETAVELGLNAKGVDSHWQRLKSRLGVSTRYAAAAIAAEYGVI